MPVNEEIVIYENLLKMCIQQAKYVQANLQSMLELVQGGSRESGKPVLNPTPPMYARLNELTHVYAHLSGISFDFFGKEIPTVAIE